MSAADGSTVSRPSTPGGPIGASASASSTRSGDAEISGQIAGQIPVTLGGTTIQIRGEWIGRLLSGLLSWVRERPAECALVAIFCLTVVAAWWLGTRVVPGHLATIQAGYERLQAEYIDDRERLTKSYLEDKAALRTQHARELEALGSRLEVVVEKFQKVADSQERMLERILLHEKTALNGSGK